MKISNIRFREYGFLCARLGGIFGDDPHKTLEDYDKSIEAVRVIAGALSKEEYEKFMKAVRPMQKDVCSEAPLYHLSLTDIIGLISQAYGSTNSF